MPYRRLPNTDKARIRALSAAIEESEKCGKSEMPFSYNTLSEADRFLKKFTIAHNYYTECYNTQARAGKKHVTNVKMARLYISHFIQVLNMSVMRSEIKAVKKKLYQLTPEDFGVPNLNTEALLIKWGKRIIEGEQQRLASGGIPIYNPTIAKVRVHYDIFLESAEQQKAYQTLTSQSLKALSSMRAQADSLILEIWNKVEEKFASVASEEQRLAQCRRFGVIYYYRTGEKQ